MGQRKEPGSRFIQKMAMCFVLVLTALLYCRSHLVESMRENISLSLLGIYRDGFLMQAPKALVDPYVSCLAVLINTVSVLWVLWNVVSSWCKSKQILSEAILKCSLQQPVPGWQGMWQDLSRFLGRFSPLLALDFTPEEATNPGKLTHHPIEGCLA